jgi:hypothetical protein
MTDEEPLEDIEFEFDAELPPLVPPGDNYTVAFRRAERRWLWGKRVKLFMRFQIVAPAQFAGLPLLMFCNVPPGGKWGVGFKFFRAWCLASGYRPQRKDRLSTSVFRGKYFGHESRRSRVHPIKPREHWVPSTVSSMTCCKSKPEHDAPPTLLVPFPYSYQILFPFPSYTRPVPPPSSKIDKPTAAFSRQFGKIARHHSEPCDLQDRELGAQPAGDRTLPRPGLTARTAPVIVSR